MFEPKIVSFICDWCSLQSADFIGLTRMYFPRKLSFIRVTCSGRVNPEIVTRAFKKGADGVIVMGCERGACNYRTGNYQAERWVRVYRSVLEMSGLNRDRLKLNLESDTEIIQVYDRFYNEIKDMGPIGSESGMSKERLKEVFDIIEMTLLDEDIKWLVGREWTLVSVENSYGEVFDERRFKDILEKRLKQVFISSKIRYVTRDKPMTVREISSLIKENPQDVFNVIVEMERREKVKLVDFANREPLYKGV